MNVDQIKEQARLAAEWLESEPDINKNLILWEEWAESKTFKDSELALIAAAKLLEENQRLKEALEEIAEIIQRNNRPVVVMGERE